MALLDRPRHQSLCRLSGVTVTWLARGQTDAHDPKRHPLYWTSTTSPKASHLGSLAWHIILIVAQPKRKRDPNASAEEPPAFGKIVEDHLSRVFV